MKTYEGMFLLETGQANFEEAAGHVRAIFQRNGVEVLHLKKWDERRLNYEIRGRRRGLYVLAYFRAQPQTIAAIERDVQLDEHVVRSLILSADQVTPEQMQAKTPAETHGGRADERERGEDEDRQWRGRRDRDRDRDRGEGRRERRGAAHEEPTGVSAPEKPAEEPDKHSNENQAEA